MRFCLTIASCTAVVVLVVLSAGCDSKPDKRQLRIFMADSLYPSFKSFKGDFEAENPGCELVLVPSGSVLAARKIIDARDQADVIGVADYLVIENMMRPKYADWYICFANNEVVIAYTDASKGAAGLAAENWFELLSRDDVTVGAANPYHDPCGYWTELCWQLADRYYPAVSGPPISQRMLKKCGPPADRRSDTEELLHVLESAGGIDYAFVYRSQALQHHLPSLRLPPQVNLGDVNYTDLYHQVRVLLPNRDGSVLEKRGEAIVYAITIPKNARHLDLAAKYIQFLLGANGRRALTNGYLPLADPPWTYDMANVPQVLRDGLGERNRSRRPPPVGRVPGEFVRNQTMNRVGEPMSVQPAPKQTGDTATDIMIEQVV